MGVPLVAAWDLAFHILSLTLVDEDFAGAIIAVAHGNYLHPNGQLPAYEWNFGDVNPPVPCLGRHVHLPGGDVGAGQGDREWLQRCFHKLLLNFTG